ncbi:hypothetical protein HRbin04_00663 [archaeon HR04]|jgi:hypothetical protein|nr:hypothetical protein HRbin04_00663 [archaeon HR04]
MLAILINLMGGLDYLANIAKRLVYLRGIIPLKEKILTALMYYSGSSLRSVSRLKGFSYEAVRQ